jgi:hypothetical protein
MKTKKSFSYPWIITTAILSSSLAFLSPAEALPAGVPNVPCGSLSNPSPGTLCYTITPGGGKASAGGSRQEFSTIIQSTEPEYVIASVVIEVTSAAGERNGPTVNQISPGGQASVVSVATNKLRELRQIKGELQAKATVLAGPALIEAQSKLNALSEEERTFEEVVTKITAAGQDAGKFHVTGSANPRRCGTFNLDKCGSWIEYNIYVVRRYAGDPIAAYNRAFAVAQDAQNTITRLVAQQPSLPPGTDLGYNNLPKAFVDVNGDGLIDYCRFVGDAPTIFIACMLGIQSGFDINNQNTAFTSIKGIDVGYGDRPRGFKDINSDGKADYCRFVGDNPIFESCNLAESSRFSTDQYHIKP